MDITSKIIAVLEVNNSFVHVDEIFNYVQDKTGCSLYNFASCLNQLFVNGVTVRRIDSKGREHYKMVKTSLLPEFLCEICKVQCNSYGQYETHIHGHQHVTNLHALKTGSRDRTQWYSCGICHKRFNSPEQIMLHMPKCCTRLEDYKSPGRLLSCLLPGLARD
jgi:hypothetical protein